MNIETAAACPIRETSHDLVERHTMDRIESFVAGTAGKRLTYKAYIQ